MGKEDYVSTGGSLKLKGVMDGGIRKKRKKKKPPTPDPASELKSCDASAKDVSTHGLEERREEEEEEEEEEELEDPYAGKTEAERRFEERKRKRLDERLKKEGIKSHKERVEEFNKYLSNLSEHHDMPRIGPG
jgi:protein FAM32A